MFFVLLWIAAFAAPILAFGYAARRRRRAQKTQDDLLARVRALEVVQDGGSPDRPIVVDSAAVIDGRAARFTCTACGSEVRVADHRAAIIDGARLRVAHLACRMCRLDRVVYFRLRSTS